ncbi:CapA family protein [Wenjunlia tyrosinilytica]|uniref:Poly-gamma-glutamate biosynthesis protein n=1 Tax=Wenjunlia tyrosinilytica TaxID=1544741 RepID=A0A917ZJ82_9ACTN|nr:CapA family protein [Wenjunlia tyrosinilytica]GGO84564.1 poly-gamma-glutamate biosynthesis protein [Wenjunlia tyrosinilytica]
MSKRFRRISAAVVAVVCMGGAVAVARTVSGEERQRDAPSFSIVAGGDILIHPELTAQAQKDAKAEGKPDMDFDPLMAGVAPVIKQADLAICHFETVTAPGPKGPFLGYRKFAVPPQITTTLKHIGYDTCSTASNHTLDHGPEGIKRTLDALDAAGVRHTGSARSAEEAKKINIMTVRGVKVAHLSYAYGFNDTTLPKDKPWLVNQIDEKRIEADAHRARRLGADVVITSLHWGREQHNEPTRMQLDLARKLSRDKDISLILGHHAHVVQPFEKINGTWVAYGLGNAVAKHDKPIGTTEEGVLAWFRFARINGKWQVKQADFIPTFVDLSKDIRVYDVASALKDPSLPKNKRARFRLAFHRTEGIVLNRGGNSDGLKPLQGIGNG